MNFHHNQISEAVSSEDYAKYLVSMIEALQKNQTWELAKAPKGKATQELKMQGTKARLVAKGYRPIAGTRNVFSTVVKHSFIRILLAVVAM